MSFFAKLWDLLNSPADVALDRIYRSKSHQWVADFVPPGKFLGKGAADQVGLKPDEDYISVKAQYAVMPYGRIGLDAFYPVIHSTILVGERDGAPRSITVFQGLDESLVALSKNAGTKVVMKQRTLLEQVPYRGNSMPASIALLAVDAADYAKPLLATLQKMSTIAGVKFFDLASTLAEPLFSGIQALTEVASNAAQVVFVGNIGSKTGVYLIAAVEKKAFDWDDFTVTHDSVLLNKKGDPVDDFAYILVTIEKSNERANWRDIPAIKTAAASLDEAINAGGRRIANHASGEREKVDDALSRLVWACLRSNELCETDSRRIAKLFQDKVGVLIAGLSATFTSAPTSLGEDVASDERSFEQMWHTPRFVLEDIDAFPRPPS
jgi:hypothetical protein